MLYQVLGVKPLEGTSKKNGKPFDSYILHCAHYRRNDTDLAGMEVKQIFAAKAMLADAVKKLGGYTSLLGCIIDLSFDDGGYLDRVEVMPEGTKL